MEYTTLGSTGLEVSRICLGCMSFGTTGWKDWLLDEEESRRLIEGAIERGINFFDTANMYSHGDSERILGEVLSDHNREEMVVATKVYFPPSEEPYRHATGLSRKTIEQELQNSLDRLGLDTIDLYQIHRWDYNTPIEETLRALDDAVRRGQVRYIGASSMWAHQFAEALSRSDRLGLERFQSMQNHYNLLYREEEREMMPLCRKKGLGSIPWSPLARGYLARPHDEIDATLRGKTDDFADRHPYFEGGGRAVNERVQEIAEEKEATMAQVALAWLLHQDGVDAPVVGTTSLQHVDEAARAVNIDLSEAEQEYLEAPYEPVPVSGHE
ncbi:aryl-alcohol dehydrogenase-like predicted oxidoreductase [Salinibacter ruber]|jgi:aryl-alcohol dehydrogenase-like predicted oxidoreductase|uniref:aldo/keto reductase n=1 Tax=Salinibacter ruber TaxID=146919 RepID=UPI002169EBE4|nr:aldo/keto reductase [Salinibacter ruber]MCS3751397.1 aryl-alcohol dehydrogenase-like predicted oxidoreductase [Salinibacter ruber]